MRKHLFAAAIAAAVVTTVACWPDRGTPVPTETSTEATAPRPARLDAPAAAAPAPGRSGEAARPTAPSPAAVSAAAVSGIRPEIRNSQLWRNAAWVGQVHTAMMDEFARNRAQWLNADRNGKCRLMYGVTQKYLAQIQRERGVFAGREQRPLALRAVRSTDLCESAGALSMFRAASLDGAAQYTYSPEDGDPVTGAYEPYLSAIESAVQNGYSTSGISSSIDAVVASAQGIPDPDLQLVYAAASQALESTYYWYDYEVYTGWGGGPAGPYEHEMMVMSLFRPALLQKSWRTGAAVDALGCGVAVADKLWLGAGGPVGWKILAGACALYAGGASLAYAIA